MLLLVLPISQSGIHTRSPGISWVRSLTLRCLSKYFFWFSLSCFSLAFRDTMLGTCGACCSWVIGTTVLSFQFMSSSNGHSVRGLIDTREVQDMSFNHTHCTLSFTISSWVKRTACYMFEVVLLCKIANRGYDSALNCRPLSDSTNSGIPCLVKTLLMCLMTSSADVRLVVQ